MFKVWRDAFVTRTEHRVPNVPVIHVQWLYLWKLLIHCHPLVKFDFSFKENTSPLYIMNSKACIYIEEKEQILPFLKQHNTQVLYVNTNLDILRYLWLIYLQYQKINHTHIDT